MTVGATAAVTARATYSDGTSAKVTPSWTSSAERVATVSTSGMVTASAAGIATIAGTFNGKSDTVDITVEGSEEEGFEAEEGSEAEEEEPDMTAPEVTSLSVRTSRASVTVGATARVTATAIYSDGTSAEVTPTWTSSAESVATVSISGTVTAVAAGTATITGTFDGQSDAVDITVTAITPPGSRGRRNTSSLV